MLLDEQHPGARGRGVLAHHGQQPADDDRRQAEAHLVEHQQLRLAGERAGDREHLLLAARHQPGLAVLERAQRREVVERGVHVRRVPLAVQPEVLGHGQPEEEPPVGRHVRDAEPGPRGRGDAGQVGAAELHRPGPVLEEPGDRPQRRRLPRAVGAEERDHLAATHSERKVADDQSTVISDAELVQFEYCVGARHRVQNPPSPAFSRTYLLTSTYSLVQHKRSSCPLHQRMLARTLASPPTCQRG